MPVQDTVHLPPTQRAMNAYGCVFRSASTDTLAFQRQLDRLLTLENSNGLILQASPDAHGKASNYLELATQRYILPTPDFTPDGEGGIDIEWENQGRHLAVNFSFAGDGDFISWRPPDGRYEGAPTEESLFLEKLDWLMS